MDVTNATLALARIVRECQVPPYQSEEILLAALDVQVGRIDVDTFIERLQDTCDTIDVLTQGGDRDAYARVMGLLTMLRREAAVQGA